MFERAATAAASVGDPPRRRHYGTGASFFPSAGTATNSTTGLHGNVHTNTNPPPSSPPFIAANTLDLAASPASFQPPPPGSPLYAGGAGGIGGVQEQPSVAASSLNAFLVGAYTGGPMAGRKVRGGGGGGSVGGSSVGVCVDGGVGGGGGSGSVFGGVDAPLRQLIETKERELHEIHDFRIRFV